MSAATQAESVLSHIKTHGSITSLEAYEVHGITQLGARVFELKRAGHPIKSVRIKGEKHVRYEVGSPT